MAATLRKIREPVPLLFVVCAIALTTASCGNGLGPSVAVTLNLYSVDGVVVPAPLKSAGENQSRLGTADFRGPAGATRVGCHFN